MHIFRIVLLFVAFAALASCEAILDLPDPRELDADTSGIDADGIIDVPPDAGPDGDGDGDVRPDGDADGDDANHIDGSLTASYDMGFDTVRV